MCVLVFPLVDPDFEHEAGTRRRVGRKTAYFASVSVNFRGAPNRTSGGVGGLEFVNGGLVKRGERVRLVRLPQADTPWNRQHYSKSLLLLDIFWSLRF